jgi:GTPase SAR1 family protein
MNGINWQQFGLKKNPYDTLPLVEGGDISIDKAFIGRDAEKNFLDSIFNSNSRVCLAICGDVGVGKTSLANLNKFIWKYTKEKLLFSFRREIEANADILNKNSFLIEVMGSILREIRLLEPSLLNEEPLKRALQIVDFGQTIALSGGISAFGFGLEAGKEKSSTTPIQLSTSVLEENFINIVTFIKEHEIKGLNYSGLIVHVNNFDIVLSNDGGKELAIKFFNEIRDILQTPDVYFLFLGPKNLFKDVISVHQRVKSIFYQTPLYINPLSKTEIVKAFEERMSLLKSDDVASYIKPVEDDVVFKVYDLYNGDIRSIMASIIDILGQCSEKLGKSLSVNEAMLLLGKERWERIEDVMKLTLEQKTILKYLASADNWISQKEISELFNKKQSNVSGYYFKPLTENNIIEEKERIKNKPYYGLTVDYMPLKFLIKSQEEVNKSVDEKFGQLKLL